MGLELPKTRLAVSDGALRKTGKNDTLVAELPLANIADIRVERTADYPLPCVICAVFVALAVVSKVYVTSTGIGWTGAIICLCIAGLAVLAIHGRKIVIETKDGLVGYPVADTFEEADGFVVSVKAMLSSSESLSVSTEAHG